MASAPHAISTFVQSGNLGRHASSTIATYSTVLEAVLDPTQAETMTRERWGASNFAQGQAHFAGENENAAVQRSGAGMNHDPARRQAGPAFRRALRRHDRAHIPQVDIELESRRHPEAMFLFRTMMATTLAFKRPLASCGIIELPDSAAKNAKVQSGVRTKVEIAAGSAPVAGSSMPNTHPSRGGLNRK